MDFDSCFLKPLRCRGGALPLPFRSGELLCYFVYEVNRGPLYAGVYGIWFLLRLVMVF